MSATAAKRRRELFHASASRWPFVGRALACMHAQLQLLLLDPPLRFSSRPGIRTQKALPQRCLLQLSRCVSLAAVEPTQQMEGTSRASFRPCGERRVGITSNGTLMKLVAARACALYTSRSRTQQVYVHCSPSLAVSVGYKLCKAFRGRAQSSRALLVASKSQASRARGRIELRQVIS